MGHLVRCRGGEWEIDRLGGFWLAPPGSLLHVLYHWNALPLDAAIAKSGWPCAPAWLPVAWLCCEADPAEGPLFAAAILDADPGDDTPALIACEWLEERAAVGVFDWEQGVREPVPEWDPRIEADGEDWRGPLQIWARDLIATRCAACGGRRKGDDWVEVTVFFPGNQSPHTLKRLRKYSRRLPGPDCSIEAPEDCPLCDFPAHPAPPPLAILEVAKPEAPP